MAQATKSKTGKSKTGQSRNGAKASTSAKSRAKSTSAKPKTTRQPASKRKPASRSNSAATNGSGSVPEMALDRTKAAGHAVADAASKARIPLIAGGTAVAGAAAGVILKDRFDRSRGPLKRLKSVSLPKAARQLDLDTVKSAAERVSAYGQQASDVAGALEKTRKKNK